MKDKHIEYLEDKCENLEEQLLIQKIEFERRLKNPFEDKSLAEYKDKSIYLEQLNLRLTAEFEKTLAEKELLIKNNSEYIEELENDINAIVTGFKLIDKFKYNIGRKELHKRLALKEINLSTLDNSDLSEDVLIAIQ